MVIFDLMTDTEMSVCKYLASLHYIVLMLRHKCLPALLQMSAQVRQRTVNIFKYHYGQFIMARIWTGIQTEHELMLIVHFVTFV